MLFPSLAGYMLKKIKDIIFKKIFSDYSYGSFKIELSDPPGSDLYTTCKRSKTFGKVSAR